MTGAGRTAGPGPAARTAAAVAGGILAGLGAVVVLRALLGPGAVAIGAGVGAVTLGAGILVARRRPRPASAAGLPGDLRLRRRTHPVAWVAPVLSSVLAVLAWAGVAHSSGSGWVQALGALLGAVLLVGLVAPAGPAHRAAVACVSVPADARAGRTLRLTLETDRPLRLRPRFPTGSVQRATGRLRGTRTVELECTPDRRGVVTTVAVELASCAPFGLLWWARDVEVPLPHPVFVAPRTGTPDDTAARPDPAAGDAELRVPAGVGEPRGVRPYTPGDSRHLVHWPATAHVGALMVRESERQADDPVLVEAALPADPAAAEARAERLMATVADLLVRRRPVLLATTEPDGRVVRPVRDTVDLGRRLARAVPTVGPTAGPNAGPNVGAAPGPTGGALR